MGQYDIIIKRGDSKTYNLLITSPIDDSVYYLTNSDSLYMTVKDGKDAVIKKKYIYSDQDIGGYVPIEIVPTDTENMRPSENRYIYDIELVTGDGNVVTVIPPEPNNSGSCEKYDKKDKCVRDVLAHFIILPDVTLPEDRE